MRYQRPTSLKAQRGFASVEVALTAPFLLIMLLLSADFTRVFYEFNTLTKGVRDGARLASKGGYSEANVFQLEAQTIANARNLVVFGSVNGGGTPLLSGLSIGNVTVAQRNLGTAPLVQEHVQVTATYVFQPLLPVISALGFLPQDVGMNFTLVATSTMRAI